MTDTVTFDQQHIWHPYSPTPAAMDPLPVASTSGVRVTLEDGRTLIDGMSSWWAACHGHGHPALVAAAHRQIDTMSHVMFGGLTHRPAVDLAERLLRIAGEPLNRVFFCDSGSVSVEVAIKMALQYQRGNGHPERNRLITWRSGYHGDTFGPMSVCDPDGGMHSLWAGTLTEQIFAPAPPVRGSSEPDRTDYLRQIGELIDESVAAMIIEPVVQGAGGMRFHDHELVAGVRELCDRHGILFIADEIATGFGRTGDLLATRAAGVHADILCLGKALTGGFMSLAAVLATDEVAAVIQKPEGGGALMHGPTFMANPLACAVGSAALDLVETGYWRETVPRIEGELARGLEPLRDLPGVADVRVLGAIGVVEMERPVDMCAATDAAVAAGVWLRPFGRLIYTMPPFTATTQDVAAICTAMVAAAESGVSQ
ncbi:adenosylmethionine--8-amino-7-oxononanoate transaminase [Corynebacterium sp. TAE3-ERU16]|uniref:adenosylmethionine--8-amino-7-oxononanoate transaminase n=1 Tax=Corynebacterium sp. TAE3-ERU16 TaxID=2849493 RepID=UPI001C46647C|nr:adenosylmethionine--8-amino-7-oxononanoate transaminase [Corynebacterium sp. TAE3-ERU16]MBV7293890.1 adenosylmethionine--8-amino-7-oxononanoate transaminase [Corynebacterium sp. TAE3-ERU16]